MDCQPSMHWLWSRRECLRLGVLGLTASFLPTINRPASGSGQTSTATADAVIVLWMAGGVTHIDSFDPKPDAPENVRGTLGTIATTIPGVRFTEVMPALARQAHRLTLLRSYSHTNNDHLESQAYTLSGRMVGMSQLSTEPNVGSVVAYLKGSRRAFPGYILVPGITRPGPPPYNLFGAGWLGGAFAPFAVGGEPIEPDFTKGLSQRLENTSISAQENLRPEPLTFPEGLTESRLHQRASLRTRLERTLREAEKHTVLGASESHHQNAVRLLAAPDVRRAFDLAKESDTTREHYGRTKIGGRCLLARRLVEAGARFVMVDYGYDPDYGNLWDNHCVPEQKQPHISEMAKRSYHLAGIDRAFAALIEDLANRGRLSRTLVVFLTEFGRTPKINSLGGRDHWGPAGSLFFAGGGAAAGHLVGATDRQGAYPTTRAYSPADVVATIYRALGIATNTILHDRQNRPMTVLPAGEPIPGILGV